jgi:hypothetical protein
MKYLVCLLVLALTLSAGCAYAALYAEAWEMDVDMTGAGAGVILATAMHADGGGTGTYGTDGFNYSGGVAEFLDDTNSSSNQGTAIHGAQFQALVGTGTYTVDMRIRWLSGTGGNGSQKSMGFQGASSAGRGLRLDNGWIHSVSSGVVASGGVVTAEWLDMRIIVGTDGIWNAYVGETGNLILNSTSAGSTPCYGILNNDPGNGFFLGSMGGSSTTDCRYLLDYVRVVANADPTAHFDVPEPGSMLALASGLVGMAGFALRRRRA